MIRPHKVTQVHIIWLLDQHGSMVIGQWLILEKTLLSLAFRGQHGLSGLHMALCYSMYVARVFSYSHVQTVMHIVISLVYSHMIGTDTLSRSVDWSVAPCLPMTTLVWGSFRLTPNIHTQSYS